MRRILGYILDGVFAGLLFGLVVVVTSVFLGPFEVAGVFFPLFFVSYLGLFPLWRGGVTPGQFFFGLRIQTRVGSTPNVYQLLLRAAILVLALRAIYFCIDFLYSYVLQLNAVSLIDYTSIMAWLVLFAIPFIRTRGAIGFHDHFAGTLIARNPESVRPLNNARILNSIILVLGVVAIFGIGAKFYFPVAEDFANGAGIPAIMHRLEQTTTTFAIEAPDLLDGLDAPFKYYADLHGFFGLMPLRPFQHDIERRGIPLNALDVDTEVPLYSVLLTVPGMLNLSAQDVMSQNLLRYSLDRQAPACLIEYVNRVDLLGLYTIRTVHLVLAIGLHDSRHPDQPSFVLIVNPADRDTIELISSELPEEFVHMLPTQFAQWRDSDNGGYFKPADRH